ncbi:hypothetical protein CCR85_08470 [Rhodothalassium salexigens]|uniref:murein transglycosylase A n=1 Tax=Rhodothalassium salexigens TaxID=1086 RepID=UPI0019145B59|nr:MltA domain-containing protein [Rhodothalassium salexigens]MBK5911521.1 hypothetical protein [Rhodothalassium salexigens]MBK5921357.1 hypothetical protein [Rhodothalassium salexigens]
MARPSRDGTWALVAVALAVALAGMVLALVLVPPKPSRAPEPPERTLRYDPVDYAALPGWAADDHSLALQAFLQSCRAFEKQPGERPVGPGPVGTMADWTPLCAEARSLAAGGIDERTARAFFEDRFQPLALTLGPERQGFLTGYYEPVLAGSRVRTERFDVPLYGRPPDLVTADLGAFRADLDGERIVGRVEDGRLRPMPDRGAIDRGALADRDLEIVWLDDPVEAFFLHIQGSGRIQLRDGSVLRVGYAARNGHAYRSVGRELLARGLLAPGEASAPGIKAWLRDHPDQAAALMAENPSYIFFRVVEELADSSAGPIGALGVPLTPERSLAVDRAHLPLGAPVYLDASYPAPRTHEPKPLRRLMMAQDVGGAIRGALRGDVFWGTGPKAAEIAGHMMHGARFYLLVPKTVASAAMAVM